MWLLNKTTYFICTVFFSADNSMRGIVGDDQIGAKDHTTEGMQIPMKGT